MVYLLKLVKLMSTGEWDGDIWIHMVTMALWPWLTHRIASSKLRWSTGVCSSDIPSEGALLDVPWSWLSSCMGFGIDWWFMVSPCHSTIRSSFLWLYMAVWTPVNGLMTIANMGYGYIVQLSNAVSQCHALILAPEESDQIVMLSALAMPTSYSKFWT